MAVNPLVLFDLISKEKKEVDENLFMSNFEL